LIPGRAPLQSGSMTLEAGGTRAKYNSKGGQKGAINQSHFPSLGRGRRNHRFFEGLATATAARKSQRGKTTRKDWERGRMRSESGQMTTERKLLRPAVEPAANHAFLFPLTREGERKRRAQCISHRGRSAKKPGRLLELRALRTATSLETTANSGCRSNVSLQWKPLDGTRGSGGWQEVFLTLGQKCADYML